MLPPTFTFWCLVGCLCFAAFCCGYLWATQECHVGFAATWGPVGYFSALKAIAYDYPVTNRLVSYIWGYDVGSLVRAMSLSAGGTFLAVLAARWPHVTVALASFVKPEISAHMVPSSDAEDVTPCHPHFPRIRSYPRNSCFPSFAFHSLR